MAILHNNQILNHPCFSDNRLNLWHRIHLPVAPKCNVKCIFCSHNFGSSCHTSKPGFSSQVMSPKTGAERALSEIKNDPRIRIVAVSGPGEPLANSQTFETLELIREELGDIHFCLSTNGTLLTKYVNWLVRMDFKTLTVSMSTVNPATAARLYEWAIVDGKILTGETMGSIIVEEQLRGIAKTAEAGITIKVNSILIPTFNQDDIVPLAKAINRAGASIQNIIPLVPSAKLTNFHPPSSTHLKRVRSQAAKYIVQFRHCKQCRSDVMGLPGCDVIL
ncbi:MAG: radical SAM protein [Candidatus Thorarchaeota archaeon]